MKCPKCGNSGPDVGVAFCAYCGAPLVPGAVAPPPPSPKSVPVVPPSRPPESSGQVSSGQVQTGVIPKVTAQPLSAGRRRLLVWAAAALFVVALGAAGVWAYSRTAEIAVTYVSVEPLSAPAGAGVWLTVTLHNSGAVKSESGQLGIDFRQAGQNQDAGASAFPALAPGGGWTDKAWAAVPADASLGEGSFVVTVVVGGETRATREVAFTVVEAPSETPSSAGPPGLVVSDLSVSPTSAPAGSEVTVGLTIGNQGARTSEACAVTFAIQGSGMVDEDLPSSPIPAIAAGQSWTTSVSVTIPSDRKVGGGSIVVTVVAGGEALATREVVFTVVEAPSETPSSPGPPDLVVSDLSVDPTSAPAGSKLTVRLTIRNQGERTSEACAVAFVIQGSGMIDEYLQSDPVPAIDAGQSWKTAISVTITSHRKAGEGSIIAWVDRAGKLSESESGRDNNTRSVAYTVTAPGDVIDIAAGDNHTVALRRDGSVWAWGRNTWGQVGDGTTTDRSTPVQAQGMSDVVAIACGGFHTVALRRDGTVWAWGENGAGQLGDGTMTDRSTPVQAQGMDNVVAIACGGGHTVALRGDGAVWTWGGNHHYGQLGDGTKTDRLTPVQVQGISDVVAIAGGALHTVALRRDGTVWACGLNSEGELGDGTTTDRSTPVQVQGIGDVVAIAGGDFHTVALRRDGTVWTWGYNSDGQLGDGTATDRSTPVQAQGISDMVAIAGGRYHTVALRRDGTVWAWGYNSSGQLGDGTTTDRSTPVQVQGLRDVVAIAAGWHTVALRRDGTVWAWGYNVDGQLGDGTTTDRSTPVQVQGLPDMGP